MFWVYVCMFIGTLLVAKMVKDLPVMQETRVMHKESLRKKTTEYFENEKQMSGHWLFIYFYLKYSIMDSMDMNLSKLWAIVKDREAWCAGVHGVTKSLTRLSNWTATT